MAHCCGAFLRCIAFGECTLRECTLRECALRECALLVPSGHLTRPPHPLVLHLPPLPPQPVRQQPRPVLSLLPSRPAKTCCASRIAQPASASRFSRTCAPASLALVQRERRTAATAPPATRRLPPRAGGRHLARQLPVPVANLEREQGRSPQTLARQGCSRCSRCSRAF